MYKPSARVEGVYINANKFSPISSSFSLGKVRYFSNSVRGINDPTDNLDLFSNISAYKYNHSLFLPFNVYIDIRDVLDNDYNWGVLRQILEIGETYYITIRLYYETNEGNYDYKTCGIQIVFNYADIYKLYSKINVIKMRVAIVIDNYDIYLEDVRYVYLKVERVKSEFLSDIKMNMGQVNVKERSFYNNMLMELPLTIDEDVLGDPINEVIIREGFVYNILFETDNQKLDFMDKIRELNLQNKLCNKANNQFDDGYKFYLQQRAL